MNPFIELFRPTSLNHRQTRGFFRKAHLVFLGAALASIFPGNLSAAEGTWLGGGLTGDWTDPANWTAIPGAIGTTNNQDVAIFDAAPGAHMPILIDAGRNLKTLTFKEGAGAYTIGTLGGNALHVSRGLSGEGITVDAGVTAAQIFNADLVLEPTSPTDAGQFWIYNNATDSSATLTLNGNISAGTSTATKTLVIGGSNTGDNRITGVISDGDGIVGVTVQNGSNWTFSAANTYSGGTSVRPLGGSGFFLNISHNQALGTGFVSMVNGAGLANVSGGVLTLQNEVRLSGSSVWKGDYVLSGGITVEGTTRVGFNVADNMVINSVISGSTATSGITKQGVGTLTLNAANTFEPGLAFQTGRLNVNHIQALGAGELAINAGGSTTPMLDNTSGVTISLANQLAINRDFEFIGTNNLNFTGAILSNSTAGVANRIITVNGGTLGFNGVVSNGTSSALQLRMDGEGALTLAGNNIHTGGVELRGGTLNLNNAGALGMGIFVIANNANTKIIDNTTGTALRLGNDNAQTWNTGFIFQGTNDLNLGSGSISLDGASGGTRTVTVVQNNLTIEGIINGSSTRHIQKDGAGTLIFAQDEFAPNTYAGETRVSEGVLRLAGYGALPGGIGATGGTNNLRLDGGVIEMTADSGDFERGIGTGATQVRITENGGGFSAYDTDIAVNLGGSGATVTWGGTGFADEAKLMLSSSVAQATVDFQNGINLKNTAGTATREIEVANGSAAIDAKISGVLSDSGGTGGLNKTGTGTLQLTGVNTYRGQTIITAGTLIVDGSIAESSGITIEEGASLSGHGTVSQLSGSGTISPGNSPGILTAGSVDGSGGLDFTFEFTLAPVDGVSLPDFGNATASGNDVLRLTDGMPFVFALNGTNQITVDFGLGTNPGLGDVFIGGFYSDSANFFASISGAQFVYLGLDEGLSVVVSTIQQTANFGSGDVNGYVTQFAVIPEPGSVWLLLGGLLGLLVVAGASGSQVKSQVQGSGTPGSQVKVSGASRTLPRPF